MFGSRQGILYIYIYIYTTDVYIYLYIHLKSYNICWSFQILREVKFLAPLSHKHVVRYHAAWLEYLPYDISKIRMLLKTFLFAVCSSYQYVFNISSLVYSPFADSLDFLFITFCLQECS